MEYKRGFKYFTGYEKDEMNEFIDKPNIDVFEVREVGGILPVGFKIYYRDLLKPIGAQGMK